MDKEILVIDDSWTTLVLIEWFLKENGIKSHIAIDVEKALEYLKIKTPSLILLDIRMPGISGYEFLKKYRNEDNIKDIPILIISSYDDEETIQTATSLGATGFIPKPFKLDTLLTKVKENIGI